MKIFKIKQLIKDIALLSEAKYAAEISGDSRDGKITSVFNHLTGSGFGDLAEEYAEDIAQYVKDNEDESVDAIAAYWTSTLRNIALENLQKGTEKRERQIKANRERNAKEGRGLSAAKYESSFGNVTDKIPAPHIAFNEWDWRGAGKDIPYPGALAALRSVIRGDRVDKDEEAKIFINKNKIKLSHRHNPAAMANPDEWANKKKQGSSYGEKAIDVRTIINVLDDQTGGESIEVVDYPVNQQGPGTGITTLLYAASKLNVPAGHGKDGGVGVPDIIRMLIDMYDDQLNLNIVGPILRASALKYAVAAKDKEIIKLLLTKGADVNIKDTVAATPFMYACQEGLVDIMEEMANLSGNNIDIKLKSQQGYTAKDYFEKAVKNGRVKNEEEIERGRAILEQIPSMAPKVEQRSFTTHLSDNVLEELPVSARGVAMGPIIQIVVNRLSRLNTIESAIDGAPIAVVDSRSGKTVIKAGSASDKVAQPKRKSEINKWGALFGYRWGKNPVSLEKAKKYINTAGLLRSLNVNNLIVAYEKAINTLKKSRKAIQEAKNIEDTDKAKFVKALTTRINALEKGVNSLNETNMTLGYYWLSSEKKLPEKFQDISVANLSDFSPFIANLKRSMGKKEFIDYVSNLASNIIMAVYKTLEQRNKQK